MAHDSDTRPPAVADLFYPGDGPRLASLVEGLLGDVDAEPQAAIAAMVPHAGLVYSGQCAAHVFKRVQLPKTVVILAPNHTGRIGARGGASLWTPGAFATPLGDIVIAADLANRLERECSLVSQDRVAHEREHAIEVELPFLKTLSAETCIVPLVLAWDDWSRCRELAETLARVVRAWPDPVLLLASSDMTHYESAARAEKKDRLALDAIEKLDGKALLAACHRENITMCGRAPAATVLEAARQLGATAAELVDYRHSGWVTGDDSSVVAYAGVVIR